MLEAPRGLIFQHFTTGGTAADGRAYLSGGSLDAVQFEAVLRSVADRLLPAGEFLHRHLRDDLPEGAICLTFDDLLACQGQVALPVLDRWGMTAFFFGSPAAAADQVEPLQVFRRFRQDCFTSLVAFYEAFLQACPVPVQEQADQWDTRHDLTLLHLEHEGERRYRYVRDELLGPAGYRAVMDEMISAHGQSYATLSDGLFMTADLVATLHQQGHVVGLQTHPALARLPLPAQHKAYRHSAAVVREVLGTAPAVVSHPSNSYTPTTLKVLEGLNIRMGFRSNTVVKRGGPLEVPREAAPALLHQRLAA